MAGLGEQGDPKRQRRDTMSSTLSVTDAFSEASRRFREEFDNLQVKLSQARLDHCAAQTQFDTLQATHRRLREDYKQLETRYENQKTIRAELTGLFNTLKDQNEKDGHRIKELEKNIGLQLTGLFNTLKDQNNMDGHRIEELETNAGLQEVETKSEKVKADGLAAELEKKEAEIENEIGLRQAAEQAARDHLQKALEETTELKKKLAASEERAKAAEDKWVEETKKRTEAEAKTKGAEDSAQVLLVRLRAAQDQALKIQFVLALRASTTSIGITTSASDREKQLTENLASVKNAVMDVFDAITILRTPSQAFKMLFDLTKTAYSAWGIDLDEPLSTIQLAQISTDSTQEELSCFVFACFLGEVLLEDETNTLFLPDHPAVYVYRAWCAIMANATDFSEDYLLKPRVSNCWFIPPWVGSAESIGEQIRRLKHMLQDSRVVSDHLHAATINLETPSPYFAGGLMILLPRLIKVVERSGTESVLKDQYIAWPSNNATAEEQALREELTTTCKIFLS